MARGDTFTDTRRMVIEECIACGVTFAFPDALHDRLLKTHRDFFCPNGHSQHYVGKTDAEVLQEKLDREKENVEWHRKRAEAAMDAAATAKRQRDAYKGHTTRLKQRVAKGKCPCCHCEFVNLKAHMTKRHPDYAS